MKANLQMDFVVDKVNNSILIKREFAAKRSLVWDAYTIPAIIDQWWAPKPWKAKTKTMNFVSGGSWHYAMVGPGGEEHWGWSDYTAINPIESYSGKDAFADADGNVNREMPQSSFEVKFTDCGATTLVEYKITYPDLAQLEATIEMGFKEGMTMAMENLDLIFAAKQ